MILSRSNLRVVDVAAVDKSIPVLGTVHIDSDGTTVASNGKACLAVSPVLPEIKDATPVEESKGRAPATIAGDTIKEVLKNIPRDNVFKGLLEHTDFNADTGTFKLNDGKRNRSIVAQLYQRPYIDFKKVFELARAAPSKLQVVINRKRLINLLQVIDSICPDSSGESPIFVDFTDKNNIIIRAVNGTNGQRAMGVMTAYKGEEGKWMAANLWEKRIMGIRKIKKAKMRKKGLKD